MAPAGVNTLAVHGKHHTRWYRHVGHTWANNAIVPYRTPVEHEGQMLHSTHLVMHVQVEEHSKAQQAAVAAKHADLAAAVADVAAHVEEQAAKAAAAKQAADKVKRERAQQVGLVRSLPLSYRG
jgi:hypothetical protein